MIALGSETSSKIMKQLPESMIQQDSYEIANTDYVSPEERDEVMNEFVNTAQARQYVLDGGNTPETCSIRRWDRKKQKKSSMF
mgnify:CR=1 FL=1